MAKKKKKSKALETPLYVEDNPKSIVSEKSKRYSFKYYVLKC